MKYIFVIFVVLMIVNGSTQQRPVKQRTRLTCVRRADGSCRFVDSQKILQILNQHFKTALRVWYVTLFKECAYVRGRNQIAPCKSTCDDARNNKYEKYDCFRKTCAGNRITDHCTVMSNSCELYKEFCINNRTDLYPAQFFRCSDNKLLKVGDSGNCAQKNPNHTLPIYITP